MRHASLFGTFALLLCAATASAEEDPNALRNRPVPGFSQTGTLPGAVATIQDRSPIMHAVAQAAVEIPALLSAQKKVDTAIRKVSELNFNTFVTALVDERKITVANLGSELQLTEEEARLLRDLELNIPVRLLGQPGDNLKEYRSQLDPKTRRVTLDQARIAAKNVFDQAIRDHISRLVPRQLFRFEWQTRLSERTYHLPSFVYSNGPAGIDIGLQGIAGDPDGIGIGLRFDPQRYDPRMFQEYLKETAVPEELKIEWVKKVLHPRAAFIGGFRRLFDVGNLYNIGASGSLLVPLRPPNVTGPGRSMAGILLTGSVQQTWYEATNPVVFPNPFVVPNPADVASASGVGFGVSIAYQDQVPYNYTDKSDSNKTKAVLRRWRIRSGFEYNFRNAVVTRNSYAFFLRYRDNGSGEYTLLLGEGPDKKGYVTLGVATHFTL